MATLLEDLETFIIAQDLAVADGVDIFRDTVPENTELFVSLVEYMGSPTLKGCGASTRSVQITARSLKAVEAKSKVDAIFKALFDSMDPVTYLTAQRWTVLEARNSPFKIGTDESNRVIYGFNMAVTTNFD